MTIHNQNRQLYIFSFLCFLIAGLAAIGLFGDLDLNPLFNTKIEWGILLLGVLFGSLIVFWARKRGKLDIFEFPSWISINIYVQAIFSVWLFYTSSQQFFPSLRSNFNSLLNQALILFGVTIVSLWVGYRLVFWMSSKRYGGTEKQVRRELNLKLTIFIWTVLWLFLTASVFLNFIGWGGTSIGVWSNYLAFLQVLYYAASAALLLHHFRYPTILGWVWLVIALATMSLNLVAVGSRAIIFYFIYVFILAYYATGRYKWRWLIYGVVIVMVLAPAATLLREEIPRYRAVQPQERLNTAVQSLESMLNQPVDQLVMDAVDLYAARQGSLFLITASVMRQHPTIRPFVGDQLLNEFVIGMVPRIFWRSKPAGITSLYSIYTTYADAPAETSFSEIGLAADAYRAGGWIFVIIFFIVLGGFMGWLYRMGPLMKRDEWTVFYFLMLTIFVYSRPILDITLFLFQRAILVWLFIFVLLYKRERVLDPELTST